MTRWAVYTGEMSTGRRITAMPFTGGRWSIGSGVAGSLSIDVPTSAMEFRVPVPVLHEGITRWHPGPKRRDDFRLVTEPTRMFAAVILGDQVLEAGPIWVRSGPARMISLRASGIASIWDHRLLVSHLADWLTPGSVAASELTWTGLSLGTIAKRMIQELVAHTGGSLPLVLPDDITGTNARTYPGSELAMAGQRLSELSKVENGPELAWDPRLTSDRAGVEWVMRHGTPADPTLHQTGSDWIIDTRAPRGQVGELTVTEDASNQTLRALAKGAGSDTSTLISRAAIASDTIAAGYPLLDSAASYSTVTDQDTIDSHARADLAANDRPWLTWKVTLQVSETVGQMRPGDWCTIRVGDHPLVLPGDHRARIATMSGAIGGTTVDLEFAPEES